MECDNNSDWPPKEGFNYSSLTWAVYAETFCGVDHNSWHLVAICEIEDNAQLIADGYLTGARVLQITWQAPMKKNRKAKAKK